MSTFNYFTTGEAYAASRPGVADWQTIIGKRGADADKVGNRTSVAITRTKTGNARKPENTWDARTGMAEHGKVIARVERTRDTEPDADHGTITVHFEDGSSVYLLPGDLLCVEFEIGK